MRHAKLGRACWGCRRSKVAGTGHALAMVQPAPCSLPQPLFQPRPSLKLSTASALAARFGGGAGAAACCLGSSPHQPQDLWTRCCRGAHAGVIPRIQWPQWHPASDHARAAKVLGLQVQLIDRLILIAVFKPPKHVAQGLRPVRKVLAVLPPQRTASRALAAACTALLITFWSRV